MEIREMAIKDYEAVVSLWRSCEGICLHNDVDSREWISIYLSRNLGMSFVAIENSEIIGVCLCGHDGRRGYINHLAVAQDCRRNGIGSALVNKVIEKLRMIGIRKCNGFVLIDNIDGFEFWKQIGWSERANLKIVSKPITL